MRKKKKKYANLLMLLLILFALFFIVFKNRTTKVTADELIQHYNSNAIEANSKFLNQKLEIIGNVKSFVQLESDRSLLELNTANTNFKLYCKLMNWEDEVKASSLTVETKVIIVGTCTGLLQNTDKNDTQEIFIEVEQIK